MNKYNKLIFSNIKQHSTNNNYVSTLKNFINKSYFSSKTTIVRIEYSDLEDISKTKNYSSLRKEIETAYGINGVGALIIKNIPNHYENKHRLLSLSQKLVDLPKESLEKLERPDLDYGLGWSHGKEMFDGIPDLKKGSFYAQLHVHNELTGKSNNKTPDNNIWPYEELPELEAAFHHLGNQIRLVSFDLIRCIDDYIKSIYPQYNIDNTQIIKSSDHNTGRLLHYFPKNYDANNKLYIKKMSNIKNNNKTESEEFNTSNNFLNEDNNWCGWHNDHGSFTGLASALYFDRQGNVLNDNLKLKKTGLWAQNRQGEYVKVTYGKNDVAYQIGETYQIQSGGKLLATPHAVVIEDDIPEDVHRSTFALFMEPSLDVKLNIPEGAHIDDIKTSEIYTVPKLQERFIKDGMTFKEFNELTIKSFSQSNVKT